MTIFPARTAGAIWRLLISLTLCIAAFSQLGLPGAVEAQAAIQPEITDLEPSVDFLARTITFKAHVLNAPPDAKAFLFVQPEGEEPAYHPLDLSTDPVIFVLDLEEDPLRVFSQITYAYRLELPSGDEVNSQEYQVTFRDTRFKWKSLKDDAFEVFYYDRDIDFGQAALNTAVRGLDEAQKIIPDELTRPVRIYIYLDPRDLQSAQQGLQPWAAGHASPDLSMMLVSIPEGPEQRIELERQLPHELVHILQYQSLGEKAKDLPEWLLEGSASLAEMYQNPEYASALNTAVEQNRLISFESLCDAFPRDASGAFLAYAQSLSFVNYLRDRFGTSGMALLYKKYADGMDCRAGFQAAFDTTLPEAEYRWRLEVLGVNAAALVTRNLLPYLLILALVFASAAGVMIFSARKRRAAVGAL